MDQKQNILFFLINPVQKSFIRFTKIKRNKKKIVKIRYLIDRNNKSTKKKTKVTYI